MEAVFIVKPDEFDENLFEQIKFLLSSKNNLEITISINETQSKGILRKESREEYFTRLDKAIKNLKENKGVPFTTQEFEEFSQNLLNEP